MDVVEFLEVLNEVPPPSSGKPRVPWKPSQSDDDTIITLPVFVAFPSVSDSGGLALNEIGGRLMEAIVMTDEEVVEIVKRHHRLTVSLAKAAAPRSGLR